MRRSRLRRNRLRLNRQSLPVKQSWFCRGRKRRRYNGLQMRHRPLPWSSLERQVKCCLVIGSCSGSMKSEHGWPTTWANCRNKLVMMRQSGLLLHVIITIKVCARVTCAQAGNCYHGRRYILSERCLEMGSCSGSMKSEHGWPTT